MRRRLFTGNADLAIARGFTRPRNRGCSKPLTGDGAFVRLYVYARSAREARTHFQTFLTERRYKVHEVFKVAPNGSNKPSPMDDMFITPEDISDARATGRVVPGWFIGYIDVER